MISTTVNQYRQMRVAHLLTEFRTLQHYIANAPQTPNDMTEYYTEGWTALRNCHADGQHILDCAADTSVPTPNGGPDEQSKAELQQIHLDAYSRRHMGQKIYLRQQAAICWIERRANILQGCKPTAATKPHLAANDQQLRNVRLSFALIPDLAAITDEYVYQQLYMADIAGNQWVNEDPSLSRVTRWIDTRVRD
ncbi:hypothetical protein TD95_001321 [Thielaviopsis punctulata]|uniref:Uncharacterized protein n=1 Tax=Thielaviopsis punctulata TaxID=72032 RepID=A0A0F4ZL46_9PEZI|nr:hypothetical protein TD95_001321 [Thielaviopsis punctulata]